MSIPEEVRENLRAALGLGEPWYSRFGRWLYLFVIVEPSHMLAAATGLEGLAIDEPRLIYFQIRSPVADLITQRLPQTLWVVGLSYLVGTLLALPTGIYSASRQYRWFDQFSVLISMTGFSLPSFFTGAIITEQLFRVNGIGQLLITSIYTSDVPTVMTLSVIFAALVAFFSLVADVLYGLLDPRSRYD